MQDVYKNIEDYNPGKKGKVFIVFDDMIADMIINNKLNPIVTELFIILLNNIKKGKISIQEAKTTQKEYNKQLNLIRRGNKNNVQRETLNNINNLYNVRDMVMKFIGDYGSMIHEAK